MKEDTPVIIRGKRKLSGKQRRRVAASRRAATQPDTEGDDPGYGSGSGVSTGAQASDGAWERINGEATAGVENEATAVANDEVSTPPPATPVPVSTRDLSPAAVDASLDTAHYDGLRDLINLTRHRRQFFAEEGDMSMVEMANSVLAKYEKMAGKWAVIEPYDVAAFMSEVEARARASIEETTHARITRA